MSYTILRTDKAREQLFSIIQYIADDSGSIDAALAYLDKLEHEIKKLAVTPNIGSYPRYSILKRQGYRVLIVGRHLVFYKTDDRLKQVVIHAVVDPRQQYVSLV